jgi:hypothetical protein
LIYNRRLSLPEWSDVIKQLSVLIALVLLLSACAPASPTAGPAMGETPAPTAVIPTPLSNTPVQTPAGPSAGEITPTIRPGSVYTITDALGYVDTYFVDPGLDDPTPPLGGRVMVRARLIKDGVRVGGIMAHVTWMEGGELQICDLLPAYLSGCIIEVRDFTPGVFVPVTVTMRYEDRVFAAYSAFTPQ